MWEQRLIETTRGTFEVFVKGNGTPLCITHYYSVFNTSCDYFAEAFTAHHKVYLVNLRQCGRSEKVTAPYMYGFLETVFDLEAIRCALNFHTWAYAGHSTGGILGIVYGIYFSNSLSHSVIVGAAAREYMTFSSACIYNEAHPSFMRMQQLFQLLQQPHLSPATRKAYTIERTQLSLYRPEAYATYFSQNIQKQLSNERLEFFNREIQLFDVTRKLSFMTAPTLVICGQHDVQCPVTYSIELAAQLPNATLVLFDESNHYPFLEEQAHFQQVYTDFFTQQIT